MRNILAGGAVGIVIFLSCCLMIFGASSPDTIYRGIDDGERSALQAWIEFQRWVLIVSIPALVAAIGLLWRSNQCKDQTIVTEIKNAQGAREEVLKSNESTREVMREVVVTLKNVRDDVRFCPDRRGRENEDAAVNHN